MASRNAPGFDGWKAKFERDGQQPWHALFGETVHHQMRQYANQKRPPHQSDIDVWRERMDERKQHVAKNPNKAMPISECVKKRCPPSSLSKIRPKNFPTGRLRHKGAVGWSMSGKMPPT